MKFNAKDILKLKPFDESEEEKIAGSKYANSILLTIGILLSTGLIGLGGILAVAGSNHALDFLGIGVVVSAITGGIEWHSGLKAKACNQLFACLLFSLVIIYLK